MSCFRNESINGYKDKDLDFNTWAVPQQGIFKFDFVQFGHQPSADQASSDDDIQALLEWFELTAGQLKKAAEDSSMVKNEKGAFELDELKFKTKKSRIGSILADCFRGISEFFVFTSTNLALFIDLLPDRDW
jgi:hypothetical protein